MPSNFENFQPLNRKDPDPALFEANLALWERYMPGLADQFREFRDTASQLLSNGSEGFNIHHNGQALLNMPSRQWAQKCADDV